MFALWYLSFAVDELRKRFGWTFFDIFYKTNQTGANALEDISINAAASRAAESTQPSIPKPGPKVLPVPISKPAEAPTPAAVPTPATVRIPAPVPTASTAPSVPTPATVPTPASVRIPAPVLTPAPTPVLKPETQPTSKPIPVAEPPKPFTVPLVPNPTPETVAKREVKQITPPSPQKSFKRNANDSMDKKLMEVSKAKGNGENVKNNLKNATIDFLSGESNGYTQSKG